MEKLNQKTHECMKMIKTVEAGVETASARVAAGDDGGGAAVAGI